MEHGPAVDAGQDKREGESGRRGADTNGPRPGGPGREQGACVGEGGARGDAPWGPRLSLASSAARSSDFSLAVSAFVRSAKICAKKTKYYFKY